jgi:hypothetical protein
MKRIIRLTESDLTRIVKRILNEAPTKVNGCIKGDCQNGYGEKIIQNSGSDNQTGYGDRDGYTYKGNFKNGMFDGYGVKKLNTGGTFKGHFKESDVIANSYGTFTNNKGRTFNGRWKEFLGLLTYMIPSEPQNKQYGNQTIYDLENIKKEESVDTKKCKPPLDNIWVKSSLDKNYEYNNGGSFGLGPCWWARNVKNGKVFNLTDLAKTNPNIQKSIDILNKEYLNKYSTL